MVTVHTFICIVKFQNLMTRTYQFKIQNILAVHIYFHYLKEMLQHISKKYIHKYQL